MVVHSPVEWFLTPKRKLPGFVPSLANTYNSPLASIPADPYGQSSISNPGIGSDSSENPEGVGLIVHRVACPLGHATMCKAPSGPANKFTGSLPEGPSAILFQLPPCFQLKRHKRSRGPVPLIVCAVKTPRAVRTIRLWCPPQAFPPSPVAALSDIVSNSKTELFPEAGTSSKEEEPISKAKRPRATAKIGNAIAKNRRRLAGLTRGVKRQNGINKSLIYIVSPQRVKRQKPELGVSPAY